MNRLNLLFATLSTFLLASCDLNRPPVDPVKQALRDDSIIQQYVKTKHIPALKDPSGLYYQIITPGDGSTPTTASTVKVTYTGKLLDGTIFDASPADKPLTIPLNQVITGWTIGIPKIKTGGKILLIIPSGLAYGDYGSGRIPANAVLTFEVGLLDIK